MSGTKVVIGVGKMVVIGTGSNSVNGKLLAELTSESEETPLQRKLAKLADGVAKFGIGASVLMIVLLLITYFSVPVPGGRSVTFFNLNSNEIFRDIELERILSMYSSLPLLLSL